MEEEFVPSKEELRQSEEYYSKVYGKPTRAVKKRKIDSAALV